MKFVNGVLSKFLETNYILTKLTYTFKRYLNVLKVLQLQHI